MSETAATSTSTSVPILTNKQLERYFLTTTSIAFAITIITLLGLAGVLPSNEAATIMGGVAIGGYATLTLFHIKIAHHRPEFYPTSEKINIAVETIAVLALSILGMTGTLSPQIFGLGILATMGCSYIFGTMYRISTNQSVRQSLHWLIPVALTIINFLGVTGVIGGSEASLILGITNGAGLLLFVAVHYYHNKDSLDPMDKRILPLMLITAIGLGALGIVGVSPVTIGIAGIGAAGATISALNFMSLLIANCKKDEAPPPPESSTDRDEAPPPPESSTDRYEDI